MSRPHPVGAAAGSDRRSSAPRIEGHEIQSPEVDSSISPLRTARYGIGVAFHIEPYTGRTAQGVVDDVRYIYRQYGSHPGFFRTTAPSRWSPDDRPKGLFFVWAIGFSDFDSAPVDASYWREAMDAVHALPDGGLVIANTTIGQWVDEGHFDGLYNYATLHLDEADGFGWAVGLPPRAWYVPSVLPGFSARRVAYPDETFVPRRDGRTYDEQWEAALGEGVEPHMVTITSFNEWHEGSQIEPAAAEAVDGAGQAYLGYGPISPDGYLGLTRQWVDRFLGWTWPATHRAQVHIATTSDWTALVLVEGAGWRRPERVSAGDAATYSWMEGRRLLLAQPLARAQGGGRVEVVFDIDLFALDPDGRLVFGIERGHLGSTRIELWSLAGNEPVLVDTFQWGGIASDERNTLVVEVPAASLLLNPDA